MVSYAVYIKTHSMGFIYFLNWGGGVISTKCVNVNSLSIPSQYPIYVIVSRFS